MTGYHRLTGTDRILYYVTDGQGRVLALADSSGFRSSEYDNNSSIARWRLAGGTQNGHSFNAERMSGVDVPKLSFYRNRPYDQTTGRWTQEDPIGVAGGLNLYQFNGNNPASYMDPFGLCKKGNTTQAQEGSDCEKFAQYVDKLAGETKSDAEFMMVLGEKVAGFPDGIATLNAARRK